ncbi:hypothetical protein PNQ29_00585 [Halobacterium salinarum]|uniref:hypothetical protein n=1 Tax=Halobacterium salinarum TaxID=2242 RepID=UPI0025568C4E|nr:hypothetical protein [Halobacterium salinarum]MDL0118256.1 hypothetical protein [Halobacterium salinarum]
MMDNMQILDDSTACFLSEDQDVGTVVHEDEGEVLRLEGEDITFDQMAMLRFIQEHEPAPISEIRNEYDADDEKVDEVVDNLHQRGEIYQPSKGEYRVVPEEN